ncbi:MAG: ABC transporter ATP-binding protein [Candidatus Thorarchaeota archaeon]
MFFTMQNNYATNYGMLLVESIFEIIFLIFITNFINRFVIPEENQEFEIKDKKLLQISLLSSLISFGITYTLRLIFGFYWLFNYGFWRIEIFFAGMISIYFLMFILLLTKIVPQFKENTLFHKKLFRIYIICIGVSWLVGLVFLSIDLLEIPMNWDPMNTHYDVFVLGFIWAFFTVIFDISLLYIINIVIPIDKKLPKKVFKKSSNIASVIAFSFWSIQLIFFELYLKRLFDLRIWDQDIRILFIVISAIYLITFYVFLKYKYLPESAQKSDAKLQAALKLHEEKQLEVKTFEGNNVILDVQDLKTYFYTEEGLVRALEGVSFKIYKGEVLGLVGETGCGKSVTALSILQLIRPPGKIEKGAILFDNENLLEKSKSEILKFRGNKITMIFQDPLNSLNPVYKVGDQITEVYHLHKEDDLLVEASKHPNKSIFSIAREWGEKLLHDVGIAAPEKIFDQYPHELSGGMRQRVQIAIALACEPRLLIADEPTTALDVTIQNQILKLMKDLREIYDTAILFITHDLRVISKMCDRVAVMYSGFIVEYGDIHKVFKNPYHPYTRGLITALPVIGTKKKRLKTISGLVPNLIYPPSGCRFHPRCDYCFEPCDNNIPKAIELDKNYYVACHLYDPQYKDIAQISIKNVENSISKN